MVKAFSDCAHNFVERLKINVESKAKNFFLSDVG